MHEQANRHNGVTSPLPRPGESQGGREPAVTFQTDRAGLKRVIASPTFSSSGAVRSETRRTVHFDTPTGALWTRGIALYIRKCGRAGPILGVKTRNAPTDGPFTPIAIEVRSRSLRPDLFLFDEDMAADLARLVDGQPLEARFETQIRRRSAELDAGRSRIAIACDEGTIIAGGRRAALARVELTLQAGEAGDLYDLAMQLAETCALRLDGGSETEQGFGLASPEEPRAVKAQPLSFETGLPLDDAVFAVVANTVAHFVANRAVLQASEQPEAIHQMRIALRRLRAALTLFRRRLPGAELEALRGEARRIAAALAPARDCDVFHASAIAGPLAHPDRPPDCEKLLAAVADRRSAAYRDARLLLDEPGTTRFVLKVQSFLARRAWRDARSEAELALLASPAKAFARKSLDRLLARALKRGKKLSERSDAERHELRIALKNLRYAAEFFGVLFDGRRAISHYVATASEIQDLLGAHNDVVSAKQFLDGLPAGLERTSGFILGWYAGGTASADARLLAAWKQFRKAAPFWR